MRYGGVGGSYGGSGQQLGPVSGIAITGGQITGTNVPYDIAKFGIPFIPAPTGTMGNNGAVTMGTALGAAYTGGIWAYYPAGAVAAGVPAAAAWLWTVMSSTTVGTVYNSTYTTGQPVIGTQTAFVTTGPGAFTGVTTEITGPQIVIPANSCGPSGRIIHDHSFSATNNADAKTTKIKIGATTIYQVTGQSVALFANMGWLQNTGVTNMQNVGGLPFNLADSIGALYGAFDTATALTLSWTYTRGTATDVLTHLTGRVGVAYGA